MPIVVVSIKSIVSRYLLASLLLSCSLIGACRVAPTQSEALPVPATVTIAAGNFVKGSDAAERELAYSLDEQAYGHDRTRRAGWYARESERQVVFVEQFSISRTPITNLEYAAFVDATKHSPPDVSRTRWEEYGLVHPYERTRRHAWIDGRFPAGREHHPVVLVNAADAMAYADWLSKQTGQRWLLPTEDQWEKAVRGTTGRYFPWGNGFDSAQLNSHDQGPFDTQPVGTYPAGAGEFGVLDGAGQVFEWIDVRNDNGRYGVKGGSWDDSGCGVCRPAAIHFRPAELKHILIGFRLVNLK